jgi:hypothetical protein
VLIIAAFDAIVNLARAFRKKEKTAEKQISARPSNVETRDGEQWAREPHNLRERKKK